MEIKIKGMFKSKIESSNGKGLSLELEQGKIMLRILTALPGLFF